MADLILTAVFAAAMVSAPDATGTTGFTGNTLRTWCDSASATWGDMACSLYIAGFVHGITAVQDRKTGVICLPTDLTPIEAREVYRRHARSLDRLDVRARDVFRNADMSLALALALSLQYPCDNTRP